MQNKNLFCGMWKTHKNKYGCDGEKDKFRLVSKQGDYNEQVFCRNVKFLNNAITDINISNKKIYNLTEDINTYGDKTFKTFKRILKEFNKINKSYPDSIKKKIFWTKKLNFLDEKLIQIFDEVFDGD